MIGFFQTQSFFNRFWTFSLSLLDTVETGLLFSMLQCFTSTLGLIFFFYSFLFFRDVQLTIWGDIINTRYRPMFILWAIVFQCLQKAFWRKIKNAEKFHEKVEKENKWKKPIKSVLISSSANKPSILMFKKKKHLRIQFSSFWSKKIFSRAITCYPVFCLIFNKRQYNINLILNIKFLKFKIVTWIALKKSKFLPARNHQDHMYSELTCSIRTCSSSVQL